MSTLRPKLTPFGLFGAVALALLALLALSPVLHVAAAVPIADDDGYATSHDTVLSVDAATGLLANDTGNALYVDGVVNPAHGTVVVGASGDFVYTPEPGFYGTDSFAYVASDGTDTDDATVTIDVTNQAPVAADDDYSVNKGDVLTVPAPGVLANDGDPDGDSIAVDVVGAQPANGTVVVNPDGSFTYTPNGGFSGADTFAYAVSDGIYQSNEVWVSITVVNGAPVGTDDSYTFAHENAPLTIAAPGVLANDADPDGDPITFALVSHPSNGTLDEWGADGHFVYTPDKGVAGPDSFQYLVDDGETQSAPVTVTITVTNTAPVAVDDSYSVAKGKSLTVPAPGLFANDSDADGDTFFIPTNPNASNGLVVVQPDGGFTYTPNPGFVGTDSFTYTLNDGIELGNDATVTITVTNNPPVAVDDTYATSEGSAVIDGVLYNDTDADGDPLTFTLDTPPLHGTFDYFQTNGLFKFVPDPGFVGGDSFTYQVSDGIDVAYATATITVDPINHPPVAADDAYSTAQDTPLTVPAPGLLANDSDVDGNLFTASLGSKASHGSLTLNPDGSFTYTPDPGFNGVDVFKYYDWDGFAISSSATVTITVGSGNVGNAPVAVDDDYTAPQDTPLTIGAPGVLANDSDLDGDTLTAVLIGQAWDGTVTLNADGSFTFTPDPGFQGWAGFEYYPSDGTNLGLLATVDIEFGNGSTPTPTPDPSGTPDPGPTGTPAGGDKGTPTATPTDAPDDDASETPVAGDDDDDSDDSDGGVTASGSDDEFGDDSGSDTGPATDDSDMTPTPLARTLPDTGGGPTGGDPSDALLPAILLALGLAGTALGLRRRGVSPK